MNTVTSINQVKMQKTRDHAELASVQQIKGQCQRTLEYLNARESELKEKLGITDDDPEVA
ncbi:hypothetical protein AAHW26_09165 [Klebsiella quasipneumoniae subsp. similipneumoniae]|uniref:hypothetical protein n=1 Tax=Klebsiella quasipneumoniae TaxID=1463165 RepID=UPI0035A904BD